MSGTDTRPMPAGVGVALAVAVLLFLVKYVLEQTPIGRWAERETYGLLAGNLPSFAKAGPAVVIVDIGHIPGGGGAVGETPIVTSRARLKELLDALVAAEPLAIGIDIDFSPNRRGWISSGDPTFLDHCLRLNERFPVRVGVFRGMRESPGAWLGLPRFAPLAGAMWLPAEEARRLPLSIEAVASAPALPSIGAALAMGAVGDRDLLAHPLAFALEGPTTRPVALEPHGAPIVLREVLVNYGLLEQMRREALIAATPADIAKYRDRIKNRVVLIGDLKAGLASDAFRVPGVARDQRGVLLHAALASTLLSNPIAEFSHTARIVLDLALGGALALVALWARRRHGADDDHAAVGKAVLIAVAIVFVCGFAFVVWFRVMWLDFLLVAAFLLLHPGAHTWLSKLVERMRPPRTG